MTETEKEVKAVVKAWVNMGNNPVHHMRKVTQLSVEWPSLYEAIQNLVNASVK